MAATGFDRSLEQRREALTRANEIRSKRAALKRELKAGRVDVRELLIDPPDHMLTAKVYDVLRACPKYGRVKVNKVLQVCQVSPAKTVGGLSERQRASLISMLRLRAPSARTGNCGGTNATSQHMRALADANVARLDRAEIRAQVATGQRTVTDVLRADLRAVDTMRVADLIMAQHRWGASRTRRLLRSLELSETKTIGTLTARQRRVLVEALDYA